MCCWAMLFLPSVNLYLMIHLGREEPLRTFKPCPLKGFRHMMSQLIVCGVLTEAIFQEGNLTLWGRIHWKGKMQAGMVSRIQQWGLSTWGEQLRDPWVPWKEETDVKIRRPVWPNSVMLWDPKQTCWGKLQQDVPHDEQRSTSWPSVAQQSGVRERVSIQLSRVSAVTVVG